MQAMSKHLTLAAVCLLLGFGPVQAQDDDLGDATPEAEAEGEAEAEAGQPTQGERGAEQVLVTRLYEAFNKKEWQEVTSAFTDMRNANAAVLENKNLLYLNAQAQFELKEYKATASTLDTLIGLQEDHIGAHWLRAKVYAQTKKPADIAKAKDHLIQSARAGQYVLRDVSGKDVKKLFGDFLTDSTFILNIMNASKEFVASNNLRNPFESPLREIDEDTEEIEKPVVGGGKERLKELEARIEALFTEIERLAQDRQVEELIGKFTELRQIMTEFGTEGAEIVKEKKKKWDAKLAAYSEVQLSIQLQIYINEGNGHLRAMADAIRDEDYDTALERFTLINELKDQMYNEEREVFHRNAEALFLRGKALKDRAERLKTISSFRLEVSGIIVAPPNSDEKDSSIINDRIYQEGDAVLNEATEEEIEGLTVVEIVRSTVRFRYEDTEFVRELKSPQ
jgi:hypothetical protein